ncbi:hypothetical protein [Bacillus sp. 166amftsu]|uniref:hypothetical protein n=2 Tax=Bacillus TaxID=1386 RepID=UPI00089CD8A9|nr:hypothetical protein [Bacillus sp. 166amftsu]SDY37669.1 hypothetical protein SAMN04488156_10178 [Bacillus sp. 166amftsu]
MMIKFPKFYYFLDGYFNISWDFSDLEMLTLDYKARETLEYKQGLIKDLYDIKNLNDWEFISQYVYEHGKRVLNHQKLIAMIDLMLELLDSDVQGKISL